MTDFSPLTEEQKREWRSATIRPLGMDDRPAPGSYRDRMAYRLTPEQDAHLAKLEAHFRAQYDQAMTRLAERVVECYLIENSLDSIEAAMAAMIEVKNGN